MPEIERVRKVFQSIPGVYDAMNTLMSLGMDIFWRLDLLKLIPITGKVLDVGTGTGKLESLSGRPKNFVGLDATREMLERNKNKGKIVLASATESPFKNGAFEAIISSFVLRNLPSTEDYFRECLRLLKNGGILANLDAFPERRKLVSKFFSLYFYRFVPKLGKAFSSSGSYEYLALSIKNFKTPERVAKEMTEAGFREVRIRKFISPSAAIVYGRK